LNKTQLFLVTDGFDASTAAHVDAALAALPAGFAAVQLRAKSLSGRALYDAAMALAAVVHARDARLIVNDRPDVALAAAADGVHLGQNALQVADAKRLCALAGVSTHTEEEAMRAVDGGADYLVFGPVWPTPGKSAPVGIERLAAIVRRAPVPVFAIGGVDAGRARQCVEAGARVACIRAILGQADSAAAARLVCATMVG
jgi:thiamine-phosphate pyrophosphorylase